MSTLTKDLLIMLQQCANKLLLAYDDTLRPDVWEAFEKTADACKTLAVQNHHKTKQPITIYGVKGNQFRLGGESPQHIFIHSEEINQKIKEGQALFLEDSRKGVEGQGGLVH